MSNWINELLQGTEAPVERTVKWDGEEKTVFVRRITAAERVQLVQGQKVSTKAKRAHGEKDADSETEIEVDLGAQEGTKQKLVFFAICKEDGSKLFSSHRDVGRLPGGLVNALFKVASEVNKDETEDELGKD